MSAQIIKLAAYRRAHPKRRYKCRACGEVGHNRTSCTDPEGIRRLAVEEHAESMRRLEAIRNWRTR